MTTAIVPFSPALLPLVAGFSSRYWGGSRPADPRYHRWRYIESQEFSRLWVAVAGDACVGTLCALRKPYTLGGRAESCLEVFDWHCLPELKGSGVGIRLMRAMMKEPERLIAFGAAPDVVRTLPAMGWHRIATAGVFELILSAEVLARRLQTRTGLPPALTRLPLRLPATVLLAPRRRPRPRNGRVEDGEGSQSVIRSLYDGPALPYDLLQAPEPAVRSWTASHPTNGELLTLVFYEADRSVGWTLSRVYDTGQGKHAALLEAFAPRPTPERYAWMVSETTIRLASHGPLTVRARASCPALGRALTSNRYRRIGPDVPIHTWPAPPALTAPHITLNHADEPLRPYLPTEVPATG
jgi:hypothetical protein